MTARPKPSAALPGKGAAERLRIAADANEGPFQRPRQAAQQRLLADLLDEAKRHSEHQGYPSLCSHCAELIRRAEEEIA